MLYCGHVDVDGAPLCTRAMCDLRWLRCPSGVCLAFACDDFFVASVFLEEDVGILIDP